MALENNLVVDSDAELKAFLSSILSSEGIVVNINRTFIAYNNGTNRNRVFARCANRMAQKGTDEKFVVIALMCYPALNWILKARDIDAMIEQLHDMDTDGSVRNISEIQSLLENSTGYVKPRLHLEINNIRNLTASCPECNNRKSDSGGGWIFLGRFGKYIFILIWAILLLSCLAFVLCCMSGTLKRGFLIPYVADIANVLLHWISDTIAQMFRFNT